MNDEKKNAKIFFLRLKLEVANDVSKDVESAKSYLEEEGLNVEKTVADGLQRIKQIQMKINGDKTSKEMDEVENIRKEAIDWVDKLLAENISLSALIEQEEVTMSFRKLENLTEEDKKNLLIKHFMLKFKDSRNKK